MHAPGTSAKPKGVFAMDLEIRERLHVSSLSQNHCLYQELSRTMDLAHFNYTDRYSQMYLKLLNNSFKTNMGKINRKDK